MRMLYEMVVFVALWLCMALVGEFVFAITDFSSIMLWGVVTLFVAGIISKAVMPKRRTEHDETGQ